MTNKLLGTEGVWDRHGNIEDVKREFRQFHESITSDLQYAKDEDCFIWRLSDLPILPSCRSESGKVVLIGDAAHAILPTGGQGAAMTVEDAAALGECLVRAGSKEDILKLLGVFEAIRSRGVNGCVDLQGDGRRCSFCQMANDKAREMRL